MRKAGQMDSHDKSIAEKAKHRALHLLEYMDRTEKNMRTKLAQGGYPQDVIDETIEFLKSYGYIDDQKYAYRYFNTRSQGKGRRRLFQELYQKGVHADQVQEAWAQAALDDEIDERAGIRKLVEKKVGEQTELSQKEYRRLTGFLARRGFEWEDILAVFEEKGICRQWE